MNEISLFSTMRLIHLPLFLLEATVIYNTAVSIHRELLWPSVLMCIMLHFSAAIGASSVFWTSFVLQACSAAYFRRMLSTPTASTTPEELVGIIYIVYQGVAIIIHSTTSYYLYKTTTSVFKQAGTRHNAASSPGAR